MTPFGPWSPNIPEPERIARLRCLAGLAKVYGEHMLADQLVAAENDSTAATVALQLIDALPALKMRRLLSLYAEVHKPRGNS